MSVQQLNEQHENENINRENEFKTVYQLIKY